MSTDDLRRELRAQARESESWEVPVVRRPARRPVPWRVGAVVMAAAVVVVALLVVPSWLSSTGRDPQPADRPTERPDTTTLSAVDWEPTGAQCLAMSPECVVPAQVVVDGRTLERSVLGVGDPLDEAGVAPYYEQERTGGDETEVWLLVGTYGTTGPEQPPLRLLVEGLPEVRVPASDGYRLYAVPRAATGALRVRLESTRPQDGGQLVIAELERPATEPRTDWRRVGSQCHALTVECALPERVVLDGTALEATGATAAAATDRLSGRLDVPDDGWLMVGDAGNVDTASLLLRIDDGEEVEVVVGDRPALVRLPDAATARYSLRLDGDDGRSHELFARPFQPAG